MASFFILTLLPFPAFYVFSDMGIFSFSFSFSFFIREESSKSLFGYEKTEEREHKRKLSLRFQTHVFRYVG